MTRRADSAAHELVSITPLPRMSLRRTPAHTWLRIGAAGALLALSAGARDVRSIRARPIVSSAGASMTLPASSDRYTESQTVSFALDRIDQHALPLDRTYRHFGSGRNVTVYVFDGGILGAHPELAGRVRRGYNAFPYEARLCNPHGTAVAGAIAGTTLGVAPDAEIVDVKMVECHQLRGTIEAIVRGADWAIADHAQHPGHRAVANWSFIADTSASIPELDSAVARLLAAGIPVVVSAGNVETDACHISPGNAPGVIVVGASRVHRSSITGAALVDGRAPNTAYGRCIDVFAPGDSVLLPSWDAHLVPTEQLWTGTSMAAGYVSGAIALYLEQFPAATPAEVFAHVTRNGGPLGEVDHASPRAPLLFVGPAEPVPPNRR